MDTSLNHIAIIMDGNGRWAKARGLPRTVGHKKGIEATKTIVRYAGEIGLKNLTLYAFSTENWSRPEDEINDLMGMLRFYMKGEAADLYKNNVRLSIIGFRNRLSKDIIELIEDIENKSKNNTGLHLTIALDYGARQEILNAVNTALASGSQALSKDDFEALLFTHNTPDPDLIIRTSGETRISNFLLWQAAYSEFIFTDILWPDFTPKDLDHAISEYKTRDRRYGGIERASQI